MKRSKYNSFNELPLMLTVQDVADVLGIGLAHAYEVAHRQDFPTITLGSRIIVPRDKFMAWIDEQRPKRRKYFSGYFKDSVVFVCVAKGGMNNGKETSKRRGQHPQKPNGRWEGRYTLGIDPHRPGHPEKRIRQDTGRVQGEAGRAIRDNRGIPVNHNEDYTVAEWCRLWFEPTASR